MNGFAVVGFICVAALALIGVCFLVGCVLHALDDGVKLD